MIIVDRKMIYNSIRFLPFGKYLSMTIGEFSTTYMVVETWNSLSEVVVM